MLVLLFASEFLFMQCLVLQPNCISHLFFFFPQYNFFYSNVPTSLRTIADVMNDQT